MVALVTVVIAFHGFRQRIARCNTRQATHNSATDARAHATRWLALRTVASGIAGVVHGRIGRELRAKTARGHCRRGGHSHSRSSGRAHSRTGRCSRRIARGCSLRLVSTQEQSEHHQTGDAQPNVTHRKRRFSCRRCFGRRCSHSRSRGVERGRRQIARSRCLRHSVDLVEGVVELLGAARELQSRV